MIKKIFYILIISLVVLPQLALAADSFPAFPMSFYGTASYDNSALVAGTKIQAYAGDLLVGEVEMPIDGIYGYNSPTQSRLVVGEYTGDLLFKYLSVGASEPLTGDTEIKYLGGFAAGTAVEFTLAFTKATPPPSGGGGGGGGYSPPPAPEPEPATTTEETASTTDDIASEEETDEKVKVLGVEYDLYKDLTSLYGVAGDIVEVVSEHEADTVFGQDQTVAMDDVNKKIYEKLTNGKTLTDARKYRVAYFIQFGSLTTLRLGAGERAGALNSCVAAFGKFPETLEEWMDVIKVANGRWPTQRSEVAEDRAKGEFKKIYLREPNMDNAHDNAAVTIMAYGLRPANRNLGSETVAIKTFFAIYGNNPSSASEWDVVRAIAYSGSVR